MAIECHQGAKPEETFHTIQGLLDCGHCKAIIANFGPHQSLDDDGDEIVVCPSCGSEFLPEELADARVEEILERINGGHHDDTGEISRLTGENRALEEQARTLREVAKQILLEEEQNPGVIPSDIVKGARAALGEE